MLHPSISRNGAVLNGIYPDQFAPNNAQTALLSFSADQKDVLAISHSESFGFSSFFTGTTQYGFRATVNVDPVTSLAIIKQTTPNVTIGDYGSVSYNGQGDTTTTIGSLTGKPLSGGFSVMITDFLAMPSATNNFTLNLGEGKELYNFQLLPDNTVRLYVRSGSTWTVVDTFPVGHAFVATDVVGYRVTDAKIELLINNVSVWEKARTWTAVLSDAALGVLAPASPYTFGSTANLTLGTTAGAYSLFIYNQDGAQLQIEQPIVVSAQTAVVTPVTKTDDLIVPVLAATVIAGQSQNVLAPVATTGTDWGKILTWGGIILAGIIVLAGLAWAIRGKKK